MQDTDFEEMIIQFANKRISNSPKKSAYKCSLCQDTGWIEYTDDLGYSCSRRCKCAIIEKTKQLMRLSGLSDEFLQAIRLRITDNWNMPKKQQCHIVEISVKLKIQDIILFCLQDR